MDYKKIFIEAFNQHNKDKCVEIAIEVIEKNIFTIPYFYEEILKKTLYSIDDCHDGDCIWKEHVKTSIARTVIECLYPYIIKIKNQATPLKQIVVLACPEKEYHEIGLKMIDDFFTILGYKTIFIGTNTPKNQVLNAVLRTKPKYLAISVTDYYLLFEAQKMIQNVKSAYKNIIIIVGGRAFKYNLDSIKEIGGDIYLETFEDFIKLREGDKNEISV